MTKEQIILSNFSCVANAGIFENKFSEFSKEKCLSGFVFRHYMRHCDLYVRHVPKSVTEAVLHTDESSFVFSKKMLRQKGSLYHGGEMHTK